MTASRQSGTHLGIIAASGGQVVGTDIKSGYGEVELIRQRVVIICYSGIYHSQTPHMQLHGLPCRFLLLLYSLLAAIINTTLQGNTLFLFLRQQEVYVTILLPLLISGFKAAETHLPYVKEVVIKINVIHLHCKSIKTGHRAFATSQIHAVDSHRATYSALHHVVHISVGGDVSVNTASQIIISQHVSQIAVKVLNSKTIKVHVHMICVLLCVVVSIDIQRTASVKADIQTALTAFITTQHKARYTQVNVGQVYAFVVEHVVVVEAGVTDVYVVELHHPATGGGVLDSRTVITAEMLYQTGEVEVLSFLYYIGVQSCQCYMAQVYHLEWYLQQVCTDVKCVEAGKDLLAIVFIYVKSTHIHGTRQQIQTHMLNMHLASGQFFSVSVDVAFSYRACQ